LRVRELETFAFALPSGLYPKQRGNVFKISEIPQIRVLSETDNHNNLNPNAPVLVSDLIFAVGDRKQVISCVTFECDDLAFDDADGLIYLVQPRRYIRKSPVGNINTSDLNNYYVVAGRDMPETVRPVLNFALGLRNRDAEKGLK
jgi:hypothetical protein